MNPAPRIQIAPVHSLAAGPSQSSQTPAAPTLTNHGDRSTIRRLQLRLILQGGALGVASWCMLFALVPGLAPGTEGVLLFGLAGMAAAATRLRGYALAIIAVLATIVVV